MSFGDKIHDAELAEARGRIETLTKQLSAAKKERRNAEAEADRLRRVAEFSSRPLKPPRWLTPKRRKASDRVGIVCSILSDTHFDEVVKPEEIGGLNAYDRDIAEARLRRYFERLISVPRDYLSGVNYEGAVVMLGGDIISGDIHQELAESNAALPLETVLHWSEQIAAGLVQVADHYGQVRVPVVVGNHGRRTRKPRMKGRAHDNLDWLIGQMLSRHLKDDDRITFDITDGTDVWLTVYATSFLLTHGDQASGGQGIGGIWPPIKRLRARKLERYTAADQPFDWLVMGHWHTYVHSQGLIVNGSLKGLDEYAAVNNMSVERAQQALWVTTPDQGVTFAAPIFVDSRSTEGW